MNVLSVTSTVVPAISSLLDKLISDPEQKATVQLELAKLQQETAFMELDAQLQVNLAQAKINEIEAAQANPFNSAWRPAAGWICVIGLGYEFMLRPLLPWALALAGVQGVPELPSLNEVLFELMFGLLGLGTLRTADRWKRIGALAQTESIKHLSK